MTEWQTFQLRAHMYQARGLIGSDESGLSDPFARVVFVDQSQCTQVIEETLSPTWDEMLIFNAVIIPGTLNSIRSTPPTVVVEVFDQDRGVQHTSLYITHFVTPASVCHRIISISRQRCEIGLLVHPCNISFCHHFPVVDRYSVNWYKFSLCHRVAELCRMSLNDISSCCSMSGKV